jgi:serine/threonine-protein kinase
MAIHTVASILELLRDSRLLRAEELCALEGLTTRVREPEELLEGVCGQGWLTRYQIQELVAGRGESLLLGDYLVLAPIGEGGSAHVFKARHRMRETLVALKVMRRSLLPDVALDRLRCEYEAGARLRHPNIVQILGSGRSGESYFLVTEYVEGRSLAHVLSEQGPLPVGRACDYVRQACLGLEHALEQGLVHRDMKPSNLLLAAGTGVVKVLDLGIACFAGELPGAALAVGTPDYMAPEQVSEPDRADTHADIYALGCTLYHLLTGRPPFPGGSREEKLLRHRQEVSQPVESLRPEVPRELGAIVRTAMAKQPADRFERPQSLANALSAFAEPGDCAAHFVLELGEQGLADLDPNQNTDVMPSPGLPAPSDRE